MTNLNLATDNTVSTSIDQSLAGQRVRLDLIRRNPKNDPRKGRNKARYAQMKESIRAEGVIQPILLRPITGADVPYEVVYGNTRYDISADLGNSDILANIREMTDEEARKAAIIENIQRSDLSPIEEAYSCVELLADHNNDHAEVCLIMGWPRAKLDARVLLSKCCDEVAEALVQGEIKLGHAELLAPMIHEDQQLICRRIIERGMTVSATRDRLNELSGVIANAPFDTADCASCQHNSAKFGDLFGASLGEGKCQNRSCWEDKTQNLIKVRLIEAERDYGVVHTDLTLPENGYVLLEEKGLNGVGTTQFSACFSCASYGAVVSTKPGSEGRIVGGHCFNKACHTQFNNAYKALVANATGKTAVNESTDKVSGQDGAGNPKVGVQAVGAKTTSPAKPQEVKKAIKREAFTLFSQMGRQAIQGNMSYALAISIVSLYLDMRSDLPSELLARLQKVTGIPNSLFGQERTPVEVMLAQKPVEELQSYLSQLAACTVYRRDGSDQFQKSIPGSQSIAFIKAAGMDPVDHFQMTENYLKAMTKAGIIADCKASGFEAKFDEVKGAKEFAKLAAGKADDLIKTVLAFTEFSWNGYLPETMKISAYDGSATV